MIEIVASIDFEERLKALLAEGQPRNLGEQSQFSVLLTQIGFVPARFNKQGWLMLLKSHLPPGRGTDFEKHAKPVLAKALASVLEGDLSAAEGVIERMRVAMEDAKVSRQIARKSRLPSQKLRPLDTQISNLSPLEDRLNDALSLLERAAATNNLLTAQRKRIERLAERVQFSSHRGAAAPETQGVHLMTRPSGEGCADASDATKNWGATFRDHGQFGSHPGFDSMDEESQP